MMLIKICIPFNDSSGKHIMISDKIWQRNILVVQMKGNILAQADKF